MKQKFRNENSLCGEHLKKIRDDSGLNQKEFAETLEVAPSTIWEVEAGNSNPGYSLLIKLNKVYNVNPNYILLGEGEPYMDALNLIPDRYDFGEQAQDVIDLIEKMEKSPMMRFALIAYGNKFYRNNKGIVEMDMETNAKKKKTATKSIENKNDDTI
jgi:transcriptional regulator with XRE-family HTH domain